jgi:hypothetical protein
MSTPELNEEEFKTLLEVCRFLPSFLDKGKWEPATPLEDLVLRTLARGRGTYETIVDLVESDRSLQAAMLGRSLFEDMVVAHWLALHWEDPDWLIQQFERHRNAMRLHDATLRQRHGMPAVDDVSDLAGQEDELQREFGRYAERDWWGRDHEEHRVTMSQLVKRLALADLFHPRLRGETPILEQTYALQQKAWTQALHHTAAGMHIRLGEEGAFPLAVAGPTPFLILFGNHWVFGQLIFVALELATSAETVERFQQQFFAALAVFGEVVGSPAPWADEVAKWAEEE